MQKKAAPVRIYGGQPTNPAPQNVTRKQAPAYVQAQQPQTKVVRAPAQQQQQAQTKVVRATAQQPQPHHPKQGQPQKVLATQAAQPVTTQQALTPEQQQLSASIITTRLPSADTGTNELISIASLSANTIVTARPTSADTGAS